MKALNKSAWKNAASLALGILLAAGSAQASVLFSDNFTVVDGDSANLNEDIPGTRQAGPLAPATYTTVANSSSPASDYEIGNTSVNLGQPALNGNYVLLENDASFYSNLKPDSISLTNLTVQFDLYDADGPDNPSTDDTTWAAISLSVPGSNDGWPIVGANQFGFIARVNGGIHVWAGNGDVTPSGWDNPGFALSPHWTLIFSDATGTNSAFGGVSSQVTFINGTTTLGTITLTQPLATSGLKLTFRNYFNRYAIIENLVIAGILQPQGAVLTQDTFPVAAETVVGDTATFSAAFSNSPPVSFQWQQVVMSATNTPIATNNINTGVVNVTNSGVVTSTLTLDNLQTNNSGSYWLQSTINGSGIAYSTPSPLAVGVPLVSGNVVLSYANQAFPVTSTNYFPDWPVTTNSLIYGSTSGSGPGTFTSVGDFGGNPGNPGLEYCNVDPTIMSDGIATNLIALVNGTPDPYFIAGGVYFTGVGSSITYTLNTSSAPNGFDLTNITMFGGWQDAGRNEQKYQILYATASAPTTFVPLTTADYNPSYSGSVPSVTRTMLNGSSGVLAHNVVAVTLSFNVSPAPKNDWEGYSEFIVQGEPSTGIAPTLVQDISPGTAMDVVGSQIILTAVFANYTSLQWTKNATNIVGATTSTLTLNDLSTNDAGSYVLVASNGAGSTGTDPSVVTVNPAPSADSNGLITAISTQGSTAQTFTSTWNSNALASSLIYNTEPSATGPGDFTGGTFGTVATDGSQPEVLTDGSIGTVDYNVTGEHLNWTCMGTGTDDGDGSLSFGGQSVTYTLPTTANGFGYTITNITTFGGWNDGGRDEQAYTVFYSTLQNPDIFLPIEAVDYNPTNPVGYSLVRATLTSANGALATNVQALKFDMNYPRGENGFSGYSEFAVFGTPSATPPPPVPVITAQNENGGANGFTVETDSLIAGQLPTVVGPGTFSLETLTNEPMDVTNLTDGFIGYHLGASCGYNPTNNPNGPVSYIVFSPTNGGSWNLTNIVVYSLWTDYGRDGQFYNVSYSTLSAPTTFQPLATVVYNPDVPENGIVSGNRVQISPQAGETALATNVHALKFDFSIQGPLQDYSWSGYSEIILEGTNLPPSAVSTAPTFNKPVLSGGNLVLTGSGGSPANGGYTLLSSTNLTTPLADWKVVATGTMVGGVSSNSIPITQSQNAIFYRWRIP